MKSKSYNFIKNVQNKMLIFPWFPFKNKELFQNVSFLIAGEKDQKEIWFPFFRTQDPFLKLKIYQ